MNGYPTMPRSQKGLRTLVAEGEHLHQDTLTGSRCVHRCGVPLTPSRFYCVVSNSGLPDQYYITAHLLHHEHAPCKPSKENDEPTHPGLPSGMHWVRDAYAPGTEGCLIFMHMSILRAYFGGMNGFLIEWNWAVSSLRRLKF